MGVQLRWAKAREVTENPVQTVLYRELTERVAMKLEAFLMMNIEPRVSANRLDSLRWDVRNKALAIIKEWEEKSAKNTDMLLAIFREIDTCPRIPRNSLLRDALFEKAYEMVPFQKK